MREANAAKTVLGAICLVGAFAGLFVGRMMIYPVAQAPGSFLERVAAESTAWDQGHRVMLLGVLLCPAAALVLWRQLHERSPWLAQVATAFVMVGAALGAGQYALDFAMLAAADLPTPEARQVFLDGLQRQPFVQLVFYRLPDLAQLGLLLFTACLWRQGPAWRVSAGLVTVAAVASLIGPQIAGNAGVRVALGLWLVGFSAVAGRMIRGALAGSSGQTTATDSGRLTAPG